uniref:Ankyrin repeat domain 6b n=1 Tax=Dicentrarchus labrax TaxID=13489 RepID=A0A8P4KN91_DICLA
MSQQDAAEVLALSERLLIASHKGQADNVVQLINKGAKVAVTKYGRSPLHLAAYKGHIEVVHILLKAGCDLDIQDDAGDTPLHVAAALNHKKTVRLLLEAGADSRICNNAGQTALDQAREYNNPDVALLLTKAPQVQSFVRGRSVRKRRDKLKAEGRAQSVPRDEMLPCKDSASAADDTQSSDRAACRHTQATESNTRRGKNGKQKEKPSLSDPLRRKETRQRKDKLRGAALHASIPPHNYKAYQLYTLYRNKDGKIMQAPLNGCRCEPLINKLENQLEATKEEMKTEIHTVQDLMNSKMGQLDRKNKHQIRALDKMTVERVSAERSECLQRIEQRALQERLEAEKRQASLVSELKSWCLSKLQNMEVRFTGDPSGSTKLRRSSSTTEVTSPAAAKSPLSSVQVVRPKERSVISIDTQKKNQDQQDVEHGARAGRNHRASSLSPATERRCSSRTEAGLRDRERGRDRGKHHKKHSQGRTKSRGATGVRTLEVFGDQPSEPSFAQERDNMHALEVTQYFFEAVSTQMERWYERKVQEARWQANQRAQADRAALVERITYLEDELRMLRTNRHDDC